MGNFWDDWATAHRNWRAISILVMLLALVLWALVSKHDMSRKPLYVEHEEAFVREVRKVDLRGGTRSGGGSGLLFYVVRLELPDGSTFEAGIRPPVPRVGESVPVIVEHYDDDEKHYRIDRREEGF